ncbi:hypothetical protein CAPTEDRAFT_186135 [Capitella teleta]|nr:hypothetical protein CAPTEDRAFT_186135 [Capitella teleta]|eukprot:ELU03583.1 hypothetical protein CAPTEDRAFT_186135 [Capitella teleta]
MLGLSVALLTSALLPVDIFLVSFMKDNTGHFKEWAKDEAMREFISQGVQYAYFALYLLVVLFVFLILPFAYFFYEEGDEQTTTRSRFCTAFKYSIVFVLFAAVIFLIGGLVPFRGSSGNSTDTEWAKIEHMFTDLGNRE